MLKIYVLNVNSLIQPTKAAALLDTIDDHSNSIVLISESHCAESILHKNFCSSVFCCFGNFDQSRPNGSGVGILLPHSLASFVTKQVTPNGYA